VAGLVDGFWVNLVNGKMVSGTGNKSGCLFIEMNTLNIFFNNAVGLC
jgi:hypothetical protein